MDASLTNHGRPCLLYEGFRFRLDRVTKSTKLWRCTKRACQARCKTQLDGSFISFTNHHNHEENSVRSIEVHKLRQGCKRRAADDLLERPSKIIGLELQNGTAEEGDMLPNDMIGIRRAVYRERRKKTPKLPKNREETHQCLRDYVLESSRGEAMIQVNDEDSGIIVFTTRTNLEFLCNEDDVLFFWRWHFQLLSKLLSAALHPPWF